MCRASGLFVTTSTVEICNMFDFPSLLSILSERHLLLKLLMRNMLFSIPHCYQLHDHHFLFIVLNITSVKDIQFRKHSIVDIWLKMLFQTLIALIWDFKWSLLLVRTVQKGIDRLEMFMYQIYYTCCIDTHIPSFFIMAQKLRCINYTCANVYCYKTNSIHKIYLIGNSVVILTIRSDRFHIEI